MDKTLRFAVAVEYEGIKWKHPNCPKHQLMTEIARFWAPGGCDAVRRFKGQDRLETEPNDADGISWCGTRGGSRPGGLSM